MGAWLSVRRLARPGAPPDRPVEARTDPFLIATAYFARSAELLGHAAGVLGRAEDETHYQALAEEVREAFANEYVTPAGRLLSDATTAYALATRVRLTARRRPAAAGRQRSWLNLCAQAATISARASSGTPLICDALCREGYFDAAYRLLMQRDCPSWLYAVTMGATTIWERWDSMLPDGSINPGEMTSFNHYAFGAVADWLHRTVGGLAPAEPGYRRIEFRPRPGGGLSYARARHKTPYGMAECAWSIDAGKIDVQVVVPPNTTASVVTSRTAIEDPVEVGSGIASLVVSVSGAGAGSGSPEIDSTLGEIIDDPEAWAATLAAIRDHMPEFSGGELSPKGSVDLPVRRCSSTTRTGATCSAAIAGALSGLRWTQSNRVNPTYSSFILWTRAQLLSTFLWMPGHGSAPLIAPVAVPSPLSSHHMVMCSWYSLQVSAMSVYRKGGFPCPPMYAYHLLCGTRAGQSPVPAPTRPISSCDIYHSV